MDETPKPVVGPESSHHHHPTLGQLIGTSDPTEPDAERIARLSREIREAPIEVHHEDDVMADIEPVAWHSLHPKLAKGIVEAQRLATTVENDGKNSQYTYPTQAAIACKAREAMGAAGIGLIQIGWNLTGEGSVYAQFVIVHEDGHSSPPFGATMALGTQREASKAIAAGLSVLRKYVLAGLLNMGWRDPTEDVDADDPRQKKQAQSPAQTRPPQDDGRAAQERAYQHRQQKLSVHLHEVSAGARTRFRQLVDAGFDKEMIYCLATGARQPMPDKPLISELDAVVLAGMIVEHAAAAGKPYPPTNRELLEYLGQHMQGSPLWRHGKITAEGESLDRKWPRPDGR